MTNPSVARSRAALYALVGVSLIGVAYVLAARSVGSVVSDSGPQVCGPAVFGRLDPVVAPECQAHLQNLTSFAGVAALIGTFLIVAGLLTMSRSPRRVHAYR